MGKVRSSRRRTIKIIFVEIFVIFMLRGNDVKPISFRLLIEQHLVIVKHKIGGKCALSSMGQFFDPSESIFQSPSLGVKLIFISQLITCLALSSITLTQSLLHFLRDIKREHEATAKGDIASFFACKQPPEAKSD